MTLLAVAGLTIAACSGASVPGAGQGSTQEPRIPTTTVTPTATVAPTITPPALPAEATQATPEGAAAFFRYFWAVYGYSYASLDTRIMRSICETTCNSCRTFAAQIEAAAERGDHFEGGGVSVAVAVAAPSDPTRGTMVNGVIDQKSAWTVSAQGQVVASASPNVKKGVNAAVRWDGTRWRMLAIDVLANPGS